MSYENPYTGCTYAQALDRLVKLWGGQGSSGIRRPPLDIRPGARGNQLCVRAAGQAGIAAGRHRRDLDAEPA